MTAGEQIWKELIRNDLLVEEIKQKKANQYWKKERQAW
jgi:hypothetical protein